MDHTSFSQIIIDIMVVFMILGAIDKITRGRLKLGLSEKFEEGIGALGALTLAMVGMICLAPAIAPYILAVIRPVYQLIGADPAMFAGTFLACDSGGYPLAVEMASTHDIACYSGIIMGSLLGTVIVFTIPVGLGLIRNEDRPFFAEGVLYGVITIPFGAFVGGLAAGFDITLLLINSVPTLIVSLLIAIGIKLIPDGMIRGFNIFGVFITGVIIAGLVLAAVREFCGIEIIKGMAPLADGFTVVGNIAIILAGAFPMMHLITKAFGKWFAKAGKRIGIDAVSVAGMIGCLANSIVMYPTVKDMNDRGKVLCNAFATGASFCLGDHLAFTASVEKAVIPGLIIAQLLSGITAVIVAMVFTREKTTIKAKAEVKIDDE